MSGSWEPSFFKTNFMLNKILKEKILTLVINGLKAFKDNYEVFETEIYLPIQNMVKNGEATRPDILNYMQEVNIEMSHIIECSAWTELTKCGLFFNECRNLAARLHFARLTMLKLKYETAEIPKHELQATFTEYEHLTDLLRENKQSVKMWNMLNELPLHTEYNDSDETVKKAVAILKKYKL